MADPRSQPIDPDGWALASGEARHAASPDTFWIPPASVRAALDPGDRVKLVFLFARRADARGSGERMWVRIDARAADGSYRGTLLNEPFEPGDSGLAAGATVCFESTHVVDLRPRAWRRLTRWLKALVRPDRSWTRR